MAHFAEIDNDNLVLRVVVIANDDMTDANGVENEAIGTAFCRQLFGVQTNWVQTSYNGTIRKNFSGIGFTYDVGRDAFIPPEPPNATGFDEATCQWIVPHPE